MLLHSIAERRASQQQEVSWLAQAWDFMQDEAAAVEGKPPERTDEPYPAPNFAINIHVQGVACVH